MKTKKKLPVKSAVLPSNGCTYEPQHDFFQVSEGNNYAVATLGSLNVPSMKPPRFICCKCGKVIQL